MKHVATTFCIVTNKKREKGKKKKDYSQVMESHELK